MRMRLHFFYQFTSLQNTNLNSNNKKLIATKPVLSKTGL